MAYPVGMMTRLPTRNSEETVNLFEFSESSPSSSYPTLRFSLSLYTLYPHPWQLAFP